VVGSGKGSDNGSHSGRGHRTPNSVVRLRKLFFFAFFGFSLSSPGGSLEAPHQVLAKSCCSKVVLKYKYNIQTELIPVFVNFISLVLQTLWAVID